MKHYNSIDLLKFLMSFFVIAIHTAYDQVPLNAAYLSVGSTDVLCYFGFSIAAQNKHAAPRRSVR